MTRPYYEDEWVRLYCCDATEWLYGENLPDTCVMVTDPPYGIDLASGRSGAMGDMRIAGDTDTTVRDTVLERWPHAALVFGSWRVRRPERTRMVLTWEKGEHVGMGDLALPWKPNTEEVYVLGSHFEGHRTTSVLRYNAVAGCVGVRNTGVRHHATEKPVDLMAALVAKCKPGTIYDPFSGSGSTLVAAKRLGRQAVGVEIDEAHCETAAKRLSQGVLNFGESA